ncbi:MAG: hypothetical protein A3J85_04410 [Desulfobacula sp. RIFOXYA12_FULL_46_16]|nr:MAG: hypothetical protein A3J85_04410 [Desulfobacula sp. RIFOXYA12_FULL_46_16]
MPFVQGWLRKESLTVRIETRCACCSKPMSIDIDSRLNCQVHSSDAKPLIFIPDIDFATLSDPSIIEAF